MTKRFALLGGGVILAACFLLAWLYSERATQEVYDAANQHNVTLTRAFSNIIWPTYRRFLMDAGSMPTDELQVHPTIASLDAAVREIMKGLPVIKVKVYHRDGMTVYSSEATDIGADVSLNDGFVAALGGHVVSNAKFKDSFNAFDGVILNRDVLETYVPIHGPSGAIEGVIEIYRDLTAILHRVDASRAQQFAVTVLTFSLLLAVLIWGVWRSERALLRQHEDAVTLARIAARAEEASQLKSEFLANMSHELRSPLNAIIGLSEAIQMKVFGPIQPDRYVGYVDGIADSGRYLLGVIDDILDMSNIEAERIKLEETDFDLREVVQRSLRLVEGATDKPELALSVQLPEGPIPVLGDARRLQQALVHLISNATKFTPSGGRVSVSADASSVSGITVTVADTGIGIKSEDIERVLKPFGQVASAYAREHGGAGLGLPISKALVELHEGSLELSSTPSGTTVRVALPAWRYKGTDVPVAA